MINSRKKRYIFYTSRSQHVSIVIDEVTLAIILNTPGSFPAPAAMAPPLHRNRHHINNPSASTRPSQCDIVIHSTRPRGEVKGWIDSARSVTPPGEWTEGRSSKCKFSPIRVIGRQPPHGVCYRRKTWQQDFQMRNVLSSTEKKTQLIILFTSISSSLFLLFNFFTNTSQDCPLESHHKYWVHFFLAYR